MMRAFTRTLIFLLAIQVLSYSASAQQAAASNSLQKFAGTWAGKCQDGRTFVVLSLQNTGDQLGGTVSIGNMHGDDEGACVLVSAPPVPEHAQKISAAVANGNVLSFNGARRPDGSVPRFELNQTGSDKAELKLLGTPVESHPWVLMKTQKSE